MKWMTTAAALALTVTLGACSSDNPREAARDVRDAATDALPDADPIVIKRLQKLANKADCRALQDEFDTADNNGKADLMAYIDTLLEDAGCYN